MDELLTIAPFVLGTLVGVLIFFLLETVLSSLASHPRE